MNIITLAEAKERLSIDFNTKDNEITIMANSIESYLSFATGLPLSTLQTSNINIYNIVKEYILLKLYLDYYNAHTDIDDLRLTQILKQLQVVAHLV